jgi:hypothetical protein
MSSTRTVIVVDRELPKGLAANAVAILSISLGATEPGLPGPDVVDGGGRTHQGLFPGGLPILGGDRPRLAALHDGARERGLRVVSLPAVAQQTNSYETFTSTVAATAAEDLEYVGVLVHGEGKAVRAVTGDLPLLR